MIKLKKVEVPEVLAEKQDEWTAALLAYINDNEQPPNSVRYRYRDPQIKSAIRKESFDKCIYCESKISATQPGDTEHIRPFATHPSLTFAWDNLCFCCRTCNHKKLDFDEPDALINPFVDDPSAHLRFVGALVINIVGDPKGRSTRTVLGLSRIDLVERRVERIEYIQALLDLWANEPEGPEKKALAKQLNEETEDSKEYTATVRAFLRDAEFA